MLCIVDAEKVRKKKKTEKTLEMDAKSKQKTKKNTYLKLQLHVVSETNKKKVN